MIFQRHVRKQRLLLLASERRGCREETGRELNTSATQHRLAPGQQTNSRMEKEGRKPKTYVSTFSLALKPQAEGFVAGRQKKDGPDTSNRTLMGNNKVEVSSSTGKEEQGKSCVD